MPSQEYNLWNVLLPIRRFNLNGVQTQNTFQDGQSLTAIGRTNLYATDSLTLQATDTAPGTGMFVGYKLRTETKRLDGTDPNVSDSFIETRVTQNSPSGSPRYRYSVTRNSLGQTLSPQLQTGESNTSITLSQPLGYDVRLSTVGLEALSYGTYEFAAYHAFGTGTQTTEIRETFQLRAIELTEFGMTKPAVPLSGANPTVDIKGSITVYPNQRDQGIPAWTPSAPTVAYRLRIGHPDLDPTDWIEIDDSASTGAPDEKGVVASFLQTNIDLTPLVTAFAALSRLMPDILLVEGRAIMDTEDGSNTVTPLALACIVDDDRELRKKDCPPYCVINAYGLISESAGYVSGAIDTAINMVGNNFEDDPLSMGYGWQIGAYRRVEEDANGNLTYHSSGQIERWIPNGSVYVPAHKDNYIRAVKNGDETFTLTFRDKSVMKFDDQNRIETWTDANGNVTLYSYEAGAGGRLESVADAFGRQSNFAYSGLSKQPSSITTHAGDSGTRTTIFAYYGSGHPDEGRLSSVTDPESLVTSYTYSNGGRLATVIDPVGVAVAYTYFPDGRLESETHYGERMLEYDYQDMDQKIVITESVLSLPAAPNRVTEYRYDGYRNIVEIVDAIGNSTQRFFEDRYDPFLMTEMIAPNGGVTKYAYGPGGNVIAVTDAYGYTTRMEYGRSDFPDLVTAVIRPANGGTTRMTYNGNGNLIEIQDAMSEVTERSTNITYDPEGFPLTITDRNGHLTKYTYDYSPKALKWVETPSEHGGFRKITFTYDGFENVTSVVNDLGQDVSMTYDKNNRLKLMVDARDNPTEFQFNPLSGLLDKIISPAVNSILGSTRDTVLDYDSSGRVAEVFREISSGASQSRVAYLYDGFSQVRELTRKKHSGVTRPYEFSYDNLGRPVSSTDTESNTSSTAYAPYCVTRATTSARGVRTVMNFDLLCRLTGVQVGTPGVEDLELDVVSEARSFLYDPLSRMYSSTQPASGLVSDPSRYGLGVYGQGRYSSASGSSEGTTRTYTYDVLDRLTSVTFEDNKTALFDYDFEGNLTKMTDPENKVTQYTYHPNNALATVQIVRDEVVVGEFLYTYDEEVGLPFSITYPAGTGIVAEFKSENNDRGWNENGQLKHLRYTKNAGATLIREFEFDYDPAGNRTLQIDKSPSGTVHWTYEYDWLDRLKSVKKGTSSGDLLEVSIYDYDESDNRTVLELPQDLVKYIYAFNDADEITTRTKESTSPAAILFTESFLRDDDGNVISRTRSDTGVTITYGWDDWNKLIAVSSADSNGPTNDAKQENHYGANGFRRKKKAKSGVVTTEYATGLATAVAKGAGDPISYIQGPQILGFEKGGEFFYYLQDQLGSVRDICRGSDGAVLQSYNYTENGDKTTVNSSGPQSAKTWVGGLSVNDDVGDSGLYLMGHRHYDPSTARFISRDPIGFVGGMNLYSYANSSPLSQVDATGLRPLKWFVEVVGRKWKSLGGGKAGEKAAIAAMTDDVYGANLKVTGNRKRRLAAGKRVAKKSFGKDNVQFHQKHDSPLSKGPHFQPLDRDDCTTNIAWTKGHIYVGSVAVPLASMGGDGIVASMVDMMNPMGTVQDVVDIALMFEQPVADVGSAAGAAYQENELEVNSWVVDKLVNAGYVAGVDLRPSPFGSRFDHIPAVHQY